MQLDSQIYRFGWVDYLIFSITLMISLIIGIYYACSGGKQKTTSEYLVANRNMKVAPVALSLLVSYESSILMLGWPGEMYVYGVQFWLVEFGWSISLVLVSQLLVPLFSGLKLLSGYECLYMSVVLYGPATALKAVTGFPTWSSIIVVAVIAVIYTSIGGIKAVIWADTFQFFIMVAGMLALIIMTFRMEGSAHTSGAQLLMFSLTNGNMDVQEPYCGGEWKKLFFSRQCKEGTVKVGGIKKVFDISSRGGRLNLFNFDLDPTVRHTFWGLVVGGAIRGMGIGTNQTSIQRMATMPTVNKAKLIMLLTAPGFIACGSLACLEGLIAYAYYTSKQCDPLESKLLDNPNQILPYFVMDVFQDFPGMPGVFLAALFSACLSTLSSGYASMVTLIWSDFLQPCLPRVSDERATMVVKFMVVIAGVISIGMAQIIQTVKGPMTQIAGSLLSAFAGPLVGLFLLAAFFPHANWKGAIGGGILGLVYAMWLGFASNFSPLKTTTPYLPPANTTHCMGSTFNDTSYKNMSFWSPTMSTLMTTSEPIEYTGVELGLKAFYSISYLWIGPVSIFIVIIAGIIISFLTGPTNPADVDPMHLSPFFDRVCCCLPEFIRRKLRCGIDFSEVEKWLKEDGHVMTIEMLAKPKRNKFIVEEVRLTGPRNLNTPQFGIQTVEVDLLVDSAENGSDMNREYRPTN